MTIEKDIEKLKDWHKQCSDLMESLRVETFCKDSRLNTMEALWEVAFFLSHIRKILSEKVVELQKYEAHKQDLERLLKERP